MRTQSLFETEKSETEIQAEVLSYLKIVPMCKSVRTNNSGIKGRKSRAGKGFFDIHVCFWGLYVALEVKKVGEKLSPDQLIYQKEVRKAYGIAEAVYSVRDVEAVLKEAKKRINHNINGIY